MLSIKKLTTLDHMMAFADGYWNAFNGREVRSIHPLNPEIMLHEYDNVFGVYDHGQLVGGFIVNNYPIRCFDGISAEDIHTHTRKLGGVENCGELVSIWKKKGQGGFATQVWPVMIIESLKTKKANIVGSVYTKNKIKETYSVLNPRLITIVGDTNPLEIFYYEKSRLVGTYFANAFIRSYMNVARTFIPDFGKIYNDIR